MGYYVTNMAGCIEIPNEKLDDAYAALVALNDRDDLKNGGVYPGNDWDKDKDRWNPNKWFSWMPYNWPDKCKTVAAVFKEMGFMDVEECDGYLSISGYDDKTGAEEEFCRALAPFVKDGCFLDWVGEDHAMWRWKFNNGEMRGVDLVPAEARIDNRLSLS